MPSSPESSFITSSSVDMVDRYSSSESMPAVVVVWGVGGFGAMKLLSLSKFAGFLGFDRVLAVGLEATEAAVLCLLA